MVHASPHPAARWRGSVDKPTINRRNSSSNNGVGAPALNRGSTLSQRERQVGQFVLSKTMGEGTFGEVKLAVHKPTSERVAAKILEKSRIKTIADVKRVSREIKILKRVRHPNVIALYEVLDTPSTIYFMMEHCDGGELFDYIVRHQRLQEGQACFFFRQLVDGIDYLHKHDVTHRDLKPENLLLQSSSDGWRLKIIDFGLSNTHEGGKLLQTACGSPCYAAPEMIAGERYRGPAADVWSSGVVLFTLVAGFLPFEDPNTSALYKKILSGSYEKPNWLSDGAIHLLSRILNTDPAKRADVAEIRQDVWYLGAHPPATPPKATPYPVVPSRRSHIDDKLLSRAMALSGGGGGGRPEGDNLNKDAAAVATAAAESAAMGLLSGRHDPLGTAYHLLLKRSLRERTAVEAGGGGRSGRSRGTNQHNHDATTGQAGAQAPSTGRVEEHRARGNSEDHRGGREGAAGNSRAGHQQQQQQQQQPLAEPKIAEIITPRVVHGNASYASSTSSSRSGRPPFSTARRRDSSGESTATAVVGGRAESSPNSKVFKVQQPQQIPPQSSASAPRSSRPSGPAAAVMAAVQKRQQAGTAAGDGQEGTGKHGSGGETRTAALAENHGRNGGRGSKGSVEEHLGGQQAAQVVAPRRPVPKLSFRGISRTADAGSIASGRDETGKRPSSAAVLASQTARARNNREGGDQGGFFARHSRATAAAAGHSRAAHRERAGSGSSNGSTIGSNGKSAGGSGAVKGAGGALPRRPLTARAPLRSSAPTPRLSNDFSLARPQGSPLTSGNISAAAPSPRAAVPARPTSEREKGRVSLGAPLAAEPVATTGTGPPSPVLAVPTKRSTARQQPSLRVRISNLSSKPGVSQPQRHQRRLEPSVTEVGRAAAEAVAASLAATTLATRKSDTNSSAGPAPRRPSLSSMPPASGGTSAAAPTVGSAAARVPWGKKGSSAGPPGGSSSDRDGRTATSSSPEVVAIRAPPHASTPAALSWARGGRGGGYPEVLHNPGNGGVSAGSSAERAPMGERSKYGGGSTLLAGVAV